MDLVDVDSGSSHSILPSHCCPRHVAQTSERASKLDASSFSDGRGDPFYEKLVTLKGLFSGNLSEVGIGILRSNCLAFPSLMSK